LRRREPISRPQLAKAIVARPPNAAFFASETFCGAIRLRDIDPDHRKAEIG